VILALIYALCVNIYASGVPTQGTIVPISKPYRVRFEIRWHSTYLKPTTHERRFRFADDAINFQARARLCTYNPAPCVIWATAEPVPIPPYASTKAKVD
jgi:hypothetical protein